jgi:hypothetical protein
MICIQANVTNVYKEKRGNVEYVKAIAILVMKHKDFMSKTQVVIGLIVKSFHARKLKGNLSKIGF